MNTVLGYVLSVGYAFLCILLGEGAKKIGVPTAYSRKIVHITVGFEWVILARYFGASVRTFAVCLFFLIILYISYRKKWFGGMGSDGENEKGTVYYAASMSAMALLCIFFPDLLLPFGVAVICTSLGDGFAGVIGQSFPQNPKIYGNKTLVGALANFAFSAGFTYLFTFVYDLPLSPFWCVAVGALSASVELIGKNGLDNVTVPLSVFGFTYLAAAYPSVLFDYLLPILLTPWLVAFARNTRALTPSGMAAALACDLLMSLTLGNFGFFLLLFFFALGTLCDKIKALKKDGAHLEREEKNGARDAWQVLANAGVAVLFAVLYFSFDAIVFVYVAVAVMAEALGDTAASSLGVFSKKTFNIFRWRPCPAGESGGVSLLGTASAVLFSALSVFSVAAFVTLDGKNCFSLVLAATLGTLLDSFLGAVAQTKYVCPHCGITTEKRRHCETPTVYQSGLPHFSNDAVNFSATLFTAILSLLFLFF